MAVGKQLQKPAKSVKSATKKVVRKVGRAVVEPVTDLFRSGSKRRKKSSQTSKTSPKRRTASRSTRTAQK
jgi:hypothetical protein